jgi:hypothetical protein
MKLLDEIIDLAVSEEGSISTLLRKCMVLAHTLRNDRLRVWAESELNGYNVSDDEVPEYRKVVAPAKGLFLGPAGAQIDNQPIPSAMLEEEHRQFTEFVVLSEPIAAYEDVGHDARMRFGWPPNLTILYQTSVLKGRYALNRAWQEVPGSVFVGLIDTIKTRVLRFALELKDELGLVSYDPKELSKERIDQYVTMNFYGGNNVIASRDFTLSNIEIGKGDWSALAEALKRLGVQETAVAALKSAIDLDSKDAPKISLGQRTSDWMKDLGKKSGAVALNIGVEIVKKEATKWISGYLGLGL